MKEAEETRNREIYRGTLKQKKVVYKLWAEDCTAKQIVGQMQPPLAPSTIYKWVKEFKNLSARSLLAIYEEDGPPDLIIDKWKSYNINYPEKIKEIDEPKKQKQPKSSAPTNPNENAIIAPPNCFEKNEWGLCRNAGLRSDCGPCFYLRIGRTQDDIDRLIEMSSSLPDKVQQAKESFLARYKGKLPEKE